MNTALILVDIQNDYFPDGKMELVGSLEACQRAKLLLDHFRHNGLPLVFIQHVSIRAGATFFLRGTVGIEIHETVRPLEDELVFQKHYPNSFRDTPLLDHLRLNQIEQLVICGMMTHMCIDATTRAAYDFGFGCLIAGDACATKDLLFDGKKVPAEFVHISFLAALQGTYGRVMNAASLVSLLNQRSN